MTCTCCWPAKTWRRGPTPGTQRPYSRQKLLLGGLFSPGMVQLSPLCRSGCCSTAKDHCNPRDWLPRGEQQLVPRCKEWSPPSTFGASRRSTPLPSRKVRGRQAQTARCVFRLQKALTLSCLLVEHHALKLGLEPAAWFGRKGYLSKWCAPLDLACTQELKEWAQSLEPLLGASVRCSLERLCSMNSRSEKRRALVQRAQASMHTPSDAKGSKHLLH